MEPPALVDFLLLGGLDASKDLETDTKLDRHGRQLDESHLKTG